MDLKLVVAVIVLAVVAGLALLMRRGGDETVAASPEPADGTEREATLALDDDDSDDESPELVAVTSDGWSFVPEGADVYLVPPSQPDEPWKRPNDEGEYRDGPGAGRRVPFTGEQLRPGELIGARVIRGAPDSDPWRLEAIGRDGDYRFWAFETEEAARAALAILDPRIVRAPMGDDGDPVPIGSTDFLLARQTYEITESEMAVRPYEEEEEEPLP
jgi:hypothetical protein